MSRRTHTVVAATLVVTAVALGVASNLVPRRGVDQPPPDPGSLRRDGLLWNFTMLGEAAARLSDEFRTAHSGVNWARPSQLRNRIVHGYWSIDLAVFRATAINDLPAFTAQLEAVPTELES